MREGPGIRKDLGHMFSTLRGDDDGDNDDDPGAVTSLPRPSAASCKRKSLTTGARKRPVTQPKTKHIKPQLMAQKTKKDAHNKAQGRAIPKKRERASTQQKVEPNIPLQLRENIQASHFGLGHLKWSRWTQILKERNEGKVTATSGKIAKEMAFESGKSKRAIYEFAVQTGHRCRLRVMYFKVTNGISSNKPPCSILLSARHVRRQLDGVLQGGCRVYARRALISRNIKFRGVRCSDIKKFVRKLKMSYDYAWVKPWRAPACRVVEKGGHTLSFAV